MEMSHMAPRKLLVTSCWSWYLPRGGQELVRGTAVPRAKLGQIWAGKGKRPFAEVWAAAVAVQRSRWEMEGAPTLPRISCPQPPPIPACLVPEVRCCVMVCTMW